MTFKDLREQSGMTRPQFAHYFGIPYRTVQSWELGDRQCPDYLLALMEYKLKKENPISEAPETGIYFIYNDSLDDCCSLIGYVCTEKDADDFCEAHNSTCSYHWEEYEWEKLEKLK